MSGTSTAIKVISVQVDTPLLRASAVQSSFAWLLTSITVSTALQTSMLMLAFNRPDITIAHISVLNCSILLEGGCGSDSTESSPSSFVIAPACCGSMSPPNASMWMIWLDVTCRWSGAFPQRRASGSLSSNSLALIASTGWPSILLNWQLRFDFSRHAPYGPKWQI